MSAEDPTSKHTNRVQSTLFAGVAGSTETCVTPQAETRNGLNRSALDWVGLGQAKRTMSAEFLPGRDEALW